MTSYTQRFIEKAIEGGAYPQFKFEHATRLMDIGHSFEVYETWGEGEKWHGTIRKNDVFLNPLAWQAVGKVEGWKFHCRKCHLESDDKLFSDHCGDEGYYGGTSMWQEGWLYRFAQMPYALAEGVSSGKTQQEAIEQYLATILHD